MIAKDKIAFILQEGEGYQIEFKEKVSDLDREIVAFANSSGGSIFLGVRDDGSIKGIDITNELKSQIISIAHNCDPSIKVNLIHHGSKKILEIKIAEGNDKPYRCKNGFFLRIGPSSQKLKRDEILKLIQDSGKIHFDETINEDFNYKKNFSSAALYEFLQHCNITTHLQPADILMNLNVAYLEKKKLIFNNAGILFFSQNPQKFFPESFITAVKYATHDKFSIIDKKDIYGNPIQQIEQSLQFILRHISVEADTQFKSGRSLAQRKDIYEYPLPALREAIINAVTHRDYHYDGSHIYIHLYPDHIDIENPGGLYNGLTIENLGKRSIRRNRLIADLLHHAKYIERVGSGIGRIKQSLSQNNNPAMEIQATNFFDIRFYKRIPFIDSSKLTLRQSILYNLFQERKQLTKKEAATALNVSDDTAIRELNYLLKLKVIQKSGKGKAIIYSIS